MNKDFSQAMSERTDKQLVDIVTKKRDEYQAEAIIAAQKELDIRQIDATTFNNNLEKSDLEESTTTYREDIPLEKTQIAFTLLLPIIFITFWTLLFQALEDLKYLNKLGFPAIVLFYYLIHKWFKDNGYQKKAKEFMTWTTYTLFIYIGLLIVGGLGLFIYLWLKKGSA